MEYYPETHGSITRSEVKSHVIDNPSFENFFHYYYLSVSVDDIKLRSLRLASAIKKAGFLSTSTLKKFKRSMKGHSWHDLKHLI